MAQGEEWLEQRIAEIIAKLDTLNSKVDKLDAKLTTMDTKLDQILVAVQALVPGQAVGFQVSETKRN